MACEPGTPLPSPRDLDSRRTRSVATYRGTVQGRASPALDTYLTDAGTGRVRFLADIDRAGIEYERLSTTSLVCHLLCSYLSGARWC